MDRMDQSQISVLCADDHPVVREGLRALLEAQSDMNVVALAASGEQAFQLFHKHQPDITLIDLRMPGISGVETIRKIRGDFPQARIIVLTTFQGEEDIHHALQAGAATYLFKDTLVDDLVRVVREVHAGERPVSPAIASRLVARMTHPALTPRETEVLGLVAKGGRNKEIAGELGISEETVQVHIKNLMAKLEVHDRTEAVTVALRRGILHLD